MAAVGECTLAAVEALETCLALLPKGEEEEGGGAGGGRCAWQAAGLKLAAKCRAARKKALSRSRKP